MVKVNSERMVMNMAILAMIDITRGIKVMVRVIVVKMVITK